MVFVQGSLKIPRLRMKAVVRQLVVRPDNVVDENKRIYRSLQLVVWPVPGKLIDYLKTDGTTEKITQQLYIDVYPLRDGVLALDVLSDLKRIDELVEQKIHPLVEISYYDKEYPAVKLGADKKPLLDQFGKQIPEVIEVEEERNGKMVVVERPKTYKKYRIGYNDIKDLKILDEGDHSSDIIRLSGTQSQAGGTVGSDVEEEDLQ